MKKILIAFLSIVSAIFFLCGCAEIKRVENDNSYSWAYQPNSKVSCDEGMTIDGSLNEERWSNKNKYILKDDGVEMNVTTSFSEKGLYIGAVAYDSNIKWVRRMDMYANSCFWFSVKAEDVIYEVATSTFNFYVDSNNHWNFNSANFEAKGVTNYQNEQAVSLTIEFFVPWNEINISVDSAEQIPDKVRINPHYRYYDNVGTAHWLQGMFAFDDRDRNETSQRFNADGYINVDAENALIGNAVTGQAKSDGWDLTEIGNGVVKSDVDHSQGIFFTNVCSSSYWYTVTAEVGNNIYNKSPAAVGVMDALNQIECSAFYVEPIAAKNKKPTTYSTLNFWNNNNYAWNYKQEGKVTPDYDGYDGKIQYTVVKDNGYFYYFINGQYVMTKYVSFLKERSCPGFYTLDAQGIFTDYEAHDISDDPSQVDTILANYGIYRIKTDGDVVGGSVTFSETAVRAGSDVVATILPSNRNILTGFEINGVDCYEDVKDNIVNGEYTIENVTGQTVIKPTFTRFDSSATVEVSGALKDTSGNNASDMTVSLKGSSSLLFYSLKSGGNGTYKFYVPKQGSYELGGKTIEVDGNYTISISGSGYLPQSHNILVTSKITDLNYTIEPPRRDKDSYGIIEIDKDTYVSADALSKNQSSFAFFDSGNHTSALLTATITIPKNVVMPSLYGVGFIFTDGKIITNEKSDNKIVQPGYYYTHEIGLADDGAFTGSLMGDLFRRPGSWGAGTWTEMQYNESGDSVWLNKSEATLSLALVDGYFYIWIDDTFILKVNSNGIKGGDVHYMYEGLDLTNGLKFGIYFYQTQGVEITAKVTERYDEDAINHIHSSDLYERDIFPTDYIDKINEQRGENAQKLMIKNKNNEYQNLKLSYNKWTEKNAGYYYFENPASSAAVLSAKIAIAYLDDNFRAGFTMTSSHDLTNLVNSTQFYLLKPGIQSASESNDTDFGKARDYSMTIFTDKKLYADFTLILYKDTIYLYVDNKLIEGTFTGPFNMPVSVTNSNLSYNPYASGTEFRFGLATTCSWGDVATFSNVSLKTGDDALNEITTNYLHTITWLDDDDSVLKETKVFDGQTPSYGGIPGKENDNEFKYTFTGWSPEIVPATQSVSYKATYSQTPSVYTITWKNADGTILETDENVKYGETPTYDGESPADFITDTTRYTNFVGWTPEVVGVTGDATYTAVFEKTEVFVKNMVKNGNVYSNTSVEYEAFTKKAPGYYYFSNEASTIAVLSARITVPYVDDNAMIGFTMSADDNLGSQTNCIQFYISKSKILSAVGNCENGYNKGREYFTSTNIFTAEKLYADLSLVFYNDTIYLYVDGEMCTGNFSNCYTMPVSVTSGHLKESGSYAVGTAFRFGLAESSCWRTVVTYSEVSLKTGEDGLNEIKTNKLYKGLIDNSVSKNFIKNGNNYNNKAVAYEAYVKKAPGYYYFSGEATTVAVLSARITVPYVDDNAMIGFTMSADEDLTAQENCIQFYINKNKILSAVGNCEEDGYNKGREYFTSTNIFTAEKLYADLTLILYNDTIYLYVDGELCTGTFRNCSTMPVSVTNGHLKASGTYAAGTAFRFGLAESSCWGTVVTYSNVTLKTGEDATAYIRENYSGIITE